jgi:hypothetical protein
MFGIHIFLYGLNKPATQGKPGSIENLESTHNMISPLRIWSNRLSGKQDSIKNMESFIT